MVKDGHCSIIEVACPYESSIEYLNQSVRDKFHKYIPLLNKLSQVDCNSGEIISLVIELLKYLRLSKHKEALQMTETKGSVNTLHHHFRREDFEKRVDVECLITDKDS